MTLRNDVALTLCTWRNARAHMAVAFRDAARVAPSEAERHGLHFVADRAATARRDADYAAEANGFTCRHSRWLWDACVGCRRLKTSRSAKHARQSLRPKMLAKLARLVV